ncbi:MAG: hypothetical protein JNL67_20945 [Planctomycetaceae bacterium]|nr:hypothetical protein [Planctomycetaceae bacterium]
MSNVTRILSQIESENPSAAERWRPLVYDELRKLVTARWAQKHLDQNWKATALVHEADLRVVEFRWDHQSNSHGRFLAAIAELTRRTSVEQARHKGWIEPRGGQHRVELKDATNPVAAEELLAFVAALPKVVSEIRWLAKSLCARILPALGARNSLGIWAVSVQMVRQK